eukprot:gene7084-7835_t
MADAAGKVPETEAITRTIDLDDSSPRAEGFPTALSTTLVGHFNIHHKRGLMKPPPLIPTLDTESLANYHGHLIKDVKAIQHDPILEFYRKEHDFHKATLLSVDNPEENLRDVRLVSDRHSLRLLLGTCCHPTKGAFFSRNKDFTLILYKHNEQILTLQRIKKERFPKGAGGYGKGFETMLTERNLPVDGKLRAIAHDCNYYRVGKTTCDGFGLLVRYEVDAVHGDDSIEIKSNKSRLNPSRKPDFFRNLWGQMALSNTQRALIGNHTDGVLSTIEDMALSFVQSEAGFTDAEASAVLERLFRFLEWLYGEVQPRITSTKRAVLRYSVKTNQYSLKINDIPVQPPAHPPVRPKKASVRDVTTTVKGGAIADSSVPAPTVSNPAGARQTNHRVANAGVSVPLSVPKDSTVRVTPKSTRRARVRGGGRTKAKASGTAHSASPVATTPQNNTRPRRAGGAGREAKPAKPPTSSPRPLPSKLPLPKTPRASAATPRPPIPPVSYRVVVVDATFGVSPNPSTSRREKSPDLSQKLEGLSI